MSRREKQTLIRIIASGVIFAAGLPLHYTGSIGETAQLVIFLAAYIIIAFDIVYSALRNILHGRVFDENFLMAIASIGAFILGEYPEGVAVMLFYQVGELFQSMAVSKSRRSIASLMDIRPDCATVLRGGELLRLAPEEVSPGELISVGPGERVPLDGVIESGSSHLDTSALTGESLPREVAPGDEIISGSVNQSGLLTVRVTKEYGDSTVARILELVENATDKKSKSENFITRFARYYTPAVVIAAVLLAVLPPLIISGQTFDTWIYRALTFLVISCPCALVISVPLSFFGGIGGASARGILVKGGNYLEALSKVETIVFDKTGTLTEGSFAVSEIRPADMSPQSLLELVARAEYFSSHPMASSIRQACENGGQLLPPESVQELAGMGVQATVDGSEVCAGNRRLMESKGISLPSDPGSAAVHASVNGRYAGYISLEDTLRPGAKNAIEELRSLGVKKTVMLTGDIDPVGKKVAKALSIDEVHTRLLPADKVRIAEQLLSQTGKKHTLAYVGDGINDAPVLARADVGIAMGGLGSDAAIEAADIVIMTDEPQKIADALRISRKTMRIVRQNIFLALAVKLAVLVLGACGIADMWAAVFADVGVSVLAIMNAMRAMRQGRRG